MALAGVQAAKKALERRRSSPGSGKLFLKVAKDSEETIRPLEQDDDFATAYVHSVERVTKNNRRYTIDVVCLDQEGKGRVACPGCEERAKIANPKEDRRFARKFKFWLNCIWRNGPIYKTEEVEGDNGGKYTKVVRDDAGNPEEIGRGDVLAIWSGGIRAAEELDHANTKYKGLTTRDFTVNREGTGLDTKYKVSPAVDENGDVPRRDDSAMTEADKKIAAGKTDLSVFRTALSYDESAEEVRGGGASDEGREAQERPEPSASPFRRKREQG